MVKDNFTNDVDSEFGSIFFNSENLVAFGVEAKGVYVLFADGENLRNLFHDVLDGEARVEGSSLLLPHVAFRENHVVWASYGRYDFVVSGCLVGEGVG